ncbi:hypothetical protein CYMTET_32685 [Cymbomonas tetramitiformis]|uniref:Uncharacterized protein n=1 Tax=Cymbomonas tetramitiformis TaxID=36881 RepID=A0AAE0FEL6_9CHLO|nr:hypothetical protein CYMTET_32685 [Cymbomonas tetramitiformis]
MDNPEVHAVVIGGGPAGILAVGALLEQNCTSIGWVAETFGAGRLAHYTNVPANTKVKHLVPGFTTAAQSSKIAEDPRVVQSIAAIQKTAAEEWPLLSECAEVFQAFTEAYRRDMRFRK